MMSRWIEIEGQCFRRYPGFLRFIPWWHLHVQVLHWLHLIDRGVWMTTQQGAYYIPRECEWH